MTTQKTSSDGSTASYYELPAGATELQHLISHRNMNSQIGEVFRACYRYGLVEHSPEIRDIKKILFYAKAELERLERLEKQGDLAVPAPDGWLVHDGKPLPPSIHNNDQVEVECQNGFTFKGTVGQFGGWDWEAFITPGYHIAKYRFL